MAISLKAIWIDDGPPNFLEYHPDDPFVVGVWVDLRVGTADAEGADDFRLFVCTPDWLSRNCPPLGFWGRHVLIVPKFDPALVVAKLEELLSTYDEKEWRKTAKDLARYAAWEFEDYKY